MQAKTKWESKMKLTGVSGEHSVLLDSKRPLGDDAGMTPKEMVGIGLCGCTAMDVVALMKKHKQPLEALEVSADIESSEGGHPVVFKKINLTFDLKGNLDKQKVIESVQLSQTKFCGVSAMISKAAPISYKVILNGEPLAEGEAKF
ncbi:MAG: OsmC family protein [Oligoflexia bacterium]|nr:OsmC family protein [Oligoflexia bacterium]